MNDGKNKITFMHLNLYPVYKIKVKTMFNINSTKPS